MAKNPIYQEAGRLGGKKSRGGGFAYMKRTDPERLREIARKGRAAPLKKGLLPDTSGKHDQL